MIVRLRREDGRARAERQLDLPSDDHIAPSSTPWLAGRGAVVLDRRCVVAEAVCLAGPAGCFSVHNCLAFGAIFSARPGRFPGVASLQRDLAVTPVLDRYHSRPIRHSRLWQSLPPRQSLPTLAVTPAWSHRSLPPPGGHS